MTKKELLALKAVIHGCAKNEDIKRNDTYLYLPTIDKISFKEAISIMNDFADKNEKAFEGVEGLF